MPKIAAGNWKMHGLISDLEELRLMDVHAKNLNQAQVIIALPLTLLGEGVRSVSNIHIGAQNLHQEENGPYTGEVSGAMISEMGASHVIIGHSERRQYFAESNALVAHKAQKAQAHNLIPIICMGETLEERDAGRAAEVVLAQVQESINGLQAGYILAYEPVWAIGTGRVPSNEDIAEIHLAIRKMVGESISILYGGSVKSSNAQDIFSIENVDGGLVGGASLKSQDFIPIMNAAERLS